MNFGQTFEYLRSIRSMTQNEVAKRIVSRSAITFVEQHDQIPRYDKAIGLFRNLGISSPEFDYISNGYQREAVDELIYQFEHLSDSTETDRIGHLLEQAQSVSRLTRNITAENITTVLTALSKIDTASQAELHDLVAPIWDHLEKFNDWTTLDLYLLNNILYFFDAESSQTIADRAIKTIDDKFPDLKLLKNAFLLNSAKLAVDNQQAKRAKKFLTESIKIAKATHRWDLKWLAKIRLAMLENRIDDAKSYMQILHAEDEPTFEAGIVAEFPTLAIED